MANTKVRPGQLFSPPQGFLLNGKISVTVASNNITVAIKTLAGADPSATDPVYCRIGDTVRTITAALSVTKNAGTNWFNSGSAEHATIEIDYFVYLGYNATDGVVIGFARIPYASQYNQFSTTTTNEKYCAISTITTAASTDYYEVVGRFAATLSATASFNWSVPTFTAINLIQEPIYETRVLSYSPRWLSGGTAPSVGNGTLTGKYKIVRHQVWMKLELFCQSTTTYGTGNYYFTFPFSAPADSRRDIGNAWFYNGSTPRVGVSLYNFTASTGLEMISSANASVTATSPATWASGDRLNANCWYEPA